MLALGGMSISDPRLKPWDCEKPLHSGITIPTLNSLSSARTTLSELSTH